MFCDLEISSFKVNIIEMRIKKNINMFLNPRTIFATSSFEYTPSNDLFLVTINQDVIVVRRTKSQIYTARTDVI